MRTFRIILPAVGFQPHPCLRARTKHLHIQTLVAPRTVETLARPVPPGTARVDVERLRVLLREPGAQGSRDELRAMVAPEELGCPMPGEQAREHGAHPAGGVRGGHLARQAFAAELVHHRQELRGCPIQTVIVDAVVGPDMPRMRRLHRHAHPRQGPSLAPDCAHLQFGLFPEPIDALLVDPLATPAQERPDAPLAIALMAVRQRLHLRDQFAIAPGTRLVLERGAMQVQQGACPAFGETALHQEVNGVAPRGERDGFLPTTL